MEIILTERFQKDISPLSSTEKEQILSTLIKLPKVMKEIHMHSGIGIRKIHPSGIYEARCGLKLRLVFSLDSQDILLHRAGNHEDVKRYLKNV